MLVAQAAIPQIAWGAISPELVLFGVGIVALLLDTAREQRVQVSAGLAAVVGAGALMAWAATGTTVLPGLAALGGVAQLALTLLWRDRPRVLGALITALGFIAALGMTAWQWSLSSDTELVATASAIGDMVAIDGVALFTRVTVCIAGLLTIPIGYAYAEERRIHRGEYYPLLLFAATGMTLLASAADLIMVFIAIEVLSIALYILSGFAKRDLNSQESALKYFLLGSFSSALLLYGVALTYGITGSTNLVEAGRAFASVDAPQGITLAALALLLVGFGFKTAVVPFHMWTPDVYQGAPTPVTAFQAAATKAAAFAAFVRVFVGAFGELSWSWQPVIWVLAVLTMMVGAILAVVQTDLKRMLAYSAVAHAGYVLIGLASVSRAGISGTLFYLLVYTFMSVGSFGVLALLERRTRRAVSIDDLRGLGRRYPVPAGLLAFFLLGLAGIPGTGGFMAKLAVFRAGVEAGLSVLVVVAVISSVIAAFFYTRVIVAMFMSDEPEGAAELAPLQFTGGLRLTLGGIATAMLAMGVIPGVLVSLATHAASVVG